MPGRETRGEHQQEVISAAAYRLAVVLSCVGVEHKGGKTNNIHHRTGVLMVAVVVLWRRQAGN